MNRRTFARGAALSLPVVLSGCIDGTPSNNEARPDPSEISIDGRLHNETESTHTFLITAETDDGYVLTDDSYEVPGGGTERITAIGVLGGTQTVTVSVNGAERSETLTLDIEPADHAVDGYVDITYTTAGETEIAVTPRDETTDTESSPELTGVTVSDAVVTPEVERRSDMDAWGLFLASRSIAIDYFDTDEERTDTVRAFIQATSFEGSERLVYIQAYAPQTCYALELRDDPSIDTDGPPVIDTEVIRTTPADEACGDAITPVELLMRLSFATDGPQPEQAAVRVTGSTGSQREGFQLEAEE